MKKLRGLDTVSEFATSAPMTEKRTEASTNAAEILRIARKEYRIQIRVKAESSLGREVAPEGEDKWMCKRLKLIAENAVNPLNEKTLAIAAAVTEAVLLEMRAEFAALRSELAALKLSAQMPQHHNATPNQEPWSAAPEDFSIPRGNACLPDDFFAQFE